MKPRLISATNFNCKLILIISIISSNSFVISTEILEGRQIRQTGGHGQPSRSASISDELLSKTLIPFYFQEVFNTLRQIEEENPGSLLQRLFTGVSPNCTAHSLEWIYQIFDSTKLSEAATWALHMTDAWAKPPEGILSGHTNALGDYDECVGIKAKDVTFTYPNAPVPGPGSTISRNFRGKYCASFVYPKNYIGFEIDNEKIVNLLKKLETKKEQQQQQHGDSNYSRGVRESVPVHELMELMFDLNGPWLLPSFGSCFPSSCSVRDVHWFIDNVLTTLKLQNDIDFLTFDCFVEEKAPLRFWEITMIVVLGLLVLLCLFATMADYTYVQVVNAKQDKLKEAFLSFSIMRSTTKFLNTNKSLYEERFGIECIHGLKFYTICWIVLANTWQIPLFGYHPVWNNVDMKKIYKHWTTLLITNGNVAVDTLFTLSAFVVGLKIFQLLDKHRGRINIISFYVRSFLRFTPAYAIAIGFIATLYPYFASGPYSGYMYHSAQNCKTNWWTNVLYVNNFVNATFENMCLTDTWYFANEMQFILLTPFILFIVWKSAIVGLGLIVLLIIGSVVTTGLVTYDHEFLPIGIPTREFHLYFQEIYIKPWIRFSPFLVGLACAFLTYSTKKTIKIPRLVVVGGWLLIKLSALAIIFGLQPYYDPNKDIPIKAASIYAALHRFGWGIIVAWAVFTCSKGYGGLLNKYLSWNVFKPLGRLTMCTYLVALPVQMILHLRFRQSITHDTYTMVNFFLSDLVISLTVAFILTILVEIPCHALAKLIFHHEKLVEEYQPNRERFGMFYNNEISVSVDKEKRNVFDVAIEMTQPRKRRYGMFYDATISGNYTARSH